MREVQWRTVANDEYRRLCALHRRPAEAVGGPLRTISYAGYRQPFVPNSGELLRYVSSVKGLHAPACTLFYTDDPQRDCWWIEEIHLT